MKKRCTLLFCLLSGQVLFGDSVTLKNGKEIKGDVISDGPEGVLIDYYVTKSIKDQKLVPRDEIAKVSVIPPDEKAFGDLGSLTSPANVLDTSFHDSLIEKKIPEYLAKYPYSHHLGELRAALGRLEDERSRIRKGDRKIDGTWITVSSIESDPYQTKAKIQFIALKEKAQASDSVGALQTYELIEKDYPGSRVMPDALEVALNQLDLLQFKLTQALADYDFLDKKRTNVVANAPADQAKEIKDALAKEALLTKEAIASALSDGTKFFPIFPNNKEAMGNLITLINSERTRLTALQKIPMRDGINATDEGFKLATAGKLPQAKEQLAMAQTFWPANRDIGKLTAQLDQMAKAEAAEIERQKAQSAASPAPKK
jgi:hypothetical protein